MSTHRSRPLVRRTGYGRVIVLCPAGHLVQSVKDSDWAGSSQEARVADPDYLVECQGALPDGSP